MTVGTLEEAVVRHIERFLGGEASAHLLFPTGAHYYKYGEPILRKHFPTLSVGRSTYDDLPSDSNALPQIQEIMAGSVAGMCFLYLSSGLARSIHASSFNNAIALVINFDAGMGRSPCILEDPKGPVATLALDDFLCVYKDRTYVDVEFPDARPKWDFEHDRPRY